MAAAIAACTLALSARVVVAAPAAAAESWALIREFIAATLDATVLEVAAVSAAIASASCDCAVLTSERRSAAAAAAAEADASIRVCIVEVLAARVDATSARTLETAVSTVETAEFTVATVLARASSLVLTCSGRM